MAMRAGAELELELEATREVKLGPGVVMVLRNPHNTVVSQGAAPRGKYGHARPPGSCRQEVAKTPSPLVI